MRLKKTKNGYILSCTPNSTTTSTTATTTTSSNNNSNGNNERDDVRHTCGKPWWFPKYIKAG